MSGRAYLRSVIHRTVSRIPRAGRGLVRRLPGAHAVRDRLYSTPRGALPPSRHPRPVVYLPTWLRFDEMKQRPQYVLEALERAGHDVWFVDPRARGTEVRGRLHIVPTLRNVPRSHVIVYTHFAPVAYLAERFTDAVVVYDILDDLSIYDDDEVGMPAERRVRTHHETVVRSAHVVMASNAMLASVHRSERPDLILVENGVDVDRFRPHGPAAEDLVPDGRRIVGYHGAIAPWFDVDLLTSVAAMRPEYRFVLVGPVDDRVAEAIAAVRRLPNVDVLGPRPSETIDRYVRRFDVGTVPFVVNDMTRSVTPLKMYEYLATGIGVVSTPLPACRDHPHVEVAGDATGFAGAIDRVVAAGEDRSVQWREAAEAASWDRRIRPLIDALTGLDRLVVP